MESSPLLGIRGPKASERLIAHNDSLLSRYKSENYRPRLTLGPRHRGDGAHGEPARHW